MKSGQTVLARQGRITIKSIISAEFTCITGGFDSIWKAPAHGEGHREPGTVRRCDKTQCGTRSNDFLFDISLSDKVEYFLAAVGEHYPQTYNRYLTSSTA